MAARFVELKVPLTKLQASEKAKNTFTTLNQPRKIANYSMGHYLQTAFLQPDISSGNTPSQEFSFAD